MSPVSDFSIERHSIEGKRSGEEVSSRSSRFCKSAASESVSGTARILSVFVPAMRNVRLSKLMSERRRERISILLAAVCKAIWRRSAESSRRR